MAATTSCGSRVSSRQVGRRTRRQFEVTLSIALLLGPPCVELMAVTLQHQPVLRVVEVEPPEGGEGAADLALTARQWQAGARQHR